MIGASFFAAACWLPAVNAVTEEGLTGGTEPVFSSDTWPQWRGPTRDGRCSAAAWPSELLLETSWHRTGFGKSYCGPIVSENAVFTVDTVDGREIVRALDRASGETIWEQDWEGAIKVPFYAAKNGSWIRATPAWDGRCLYVGGIEDHLVCLDGKDGSVRWQLHFPRETGSSKPSFGMVCSPLVDEEAVYVQAGGAVVKLDRGSGEILWTSMKGGNGMDGSAFSSPVIGTIQGAKQLVVQTRADLAGLDLEDGKVLWKTPVKAFRGMNILTPTVMGDSVFTSTYGGRSQRLDISPEFGVEQAWSNGTQGYMTSPVVIDGHAYLFTRSNRFSCQNLETGEVCWTSGPTGDEYWSLACQGDRILALSNNGSLRLLRASPDEYTVLFEREVSEDQTWAHVAVAGDQIFVREQTGMLALKWRAPKAEGEAFGK